MKLAETRGSVRPSAFLNVTVELFHFFLRLLFTRRMAKDAFDFLS